MTKQEWESLRTSYDPNLLRIGHLWDGKAHPEGRVPMKDQSFWQYERNGKEFVIVKCAENNFCAFTITDRAGLKEFLGEIIDAKSKPSRG